MPAQPCQCQAVIIRLQRMHACCGCRVCFAKSVLYGMRGSLLPAGDRRWKITDVVGAEDGLGVECLSGSGAIASIYARAFKEGFTLTLVSGRTVGIGAYLARLGRRCALGPQAAPQAPATGHI